MGDKVRIKLIAANMAKRQLDYEWVLYADEVKEDKKTKAKKNKSKK
jgi:ribonuclease R